MTEQIKCPHCGALINDLNINYCPHCGFSLNVNQSHKQDDLMMRNQNRTDFSNDSQQKGLGIEGHVYQDNHRYGFGLAVFFKVILFFLALGLGLGISFCWVYVLWDGLINIGVFSLLFYFPAKDFTVAMMSNAIPTILIIYCFGMYRIKWFENLAIIAKNGRELHYMENIDALNIKR